MVGRGGMERKYRSCHRFQANRLSIPHDRHHLMTAFLLPLSLYWGCDRNSLPFTPNRGERGHTAHIIWWPQQIKEKRRCHQIILASLPLISLFSNQRWRNSKKIGIAGRKLRNEVEGREGQESIRLLVFLAFPPIHRQFLRDGG